MKLKGLFRRKNTGVYFYQPPQKGGIRPAAVSLRTTDEAVAVERYLAAVQSATSLVRASALAYEVERFHRAKTRSSRHTAESTRGSQYVLALMAGRLGKRKNAASITTYHNYVGHSRSTSHAAAID